MNVIEAVYCPYNKSWSKQAYIQAIVGNKKRAYINVGSKFTMKCLPSPAKNLQNA